MTSANDRSGTPGGAASSGAAAPVGGPAAGTPGTGIRRQAVVIVHGMGEHRPGDALNGFINAGLPADGSGRRLFYSRPDTVTDSFEARRYIAPATAARPQTEFFEYHWAHLMRGNRLDDLWPTFRRMLLTNPRNVPSGLRLVWLLFWSLILWCAWALAVGPLSGLSVTDADVAESLLRGLLGGGTVAALLSYLAARVLSRGITRSFVDVVRYLDTSPRSYEVRRAVRKGFIELLRGLHEQTLFGEPRYGRIIVVGHSLGAFIAYDGITYLWGEMNGARHARRFAGLEGLVEAEQRAAVLPDRPQRPSGQPPPQELRAYQDAQRRLWRSLRGLRHPWRVTDLVTVGTSMYFADRLYLRNRREFDRRVARGELPVSPPISDPDPRTTPDPELSQGTAPREEATTVDQSLPRFTWRRNRRVLHESAPFAVVRWTNLWFPHRSGSGDWFGGPLSPLYGNGIRDVEIRGNTRGRWLWLSGRLVPGLAHSRYFRFPGDTRPESVTTVLQQAMDLDLATFGPDRDDPARRRPVVPTQSSSG